MAKVRHADGYLVTVCGRCADEQTDAGKTEAQIAEDRRATSGEDRYSAGVYAGHYCDPHWRAAGYREDLPNTVGGLIDDEIEAYDYRGES